MATLSERLAYVLTFDTTSGVKSLNKFGATAEKELSKAEKGYDKVAAGAQKFGAAAVAFAGAAGVGLYKLAVGASDARQNFQALEQIVGETSAINIKEWADGAAQSIGVSSSKAVEAARTFAQLADVAGLGQEDVEGFSTGLVELAADFSAFANVSPEQALQDIRSGFSGSTEVMRKYGIFLTEGNLKQQFFNLTGEKVTGTLTAQQRVLATNSLLWEKGSKMVGQFERESDSLVGQTAILKAELQNLADNVGQGLLPMFRDGITVMGDFAEKISNMNPESQALIGKLAGITVGLTGLIGVLSFAGGAALKMRSRFTTMGDDGTRSLNKLGKAARGAGIALGALAVAEIGFAAINELTDVAGRGKRALEELTITVDGFANGAAGADDVMLDFGNRIREIDREFRVSDLFKVFEDRIPVIGAGFTELGEDVTAFKSVIDEAFQEMLDQDPEQALQMLTAWQEQADQLDRNSKEYEQQVKMIREYLGWVRTQTAYQDILNGSTEEQADAIGEATEETNSLIGSQEKLIPTIEHLDRNVKELTEAYDENVQGARDARTAARDLANGAWDAVDAQDAFEDALVNIDEVLKDVESSERDVAKAYRDGARATDDMIVAQLEAEGVLLDTERGQRQWTEAMLESAAALGGPLGSEIVAHVGRVNGIPDEKITQIQAALDRNQVDTARRLLEAELSKAEANVGVTPTGLEAARARIEAILGRSITIRTETGGYTPSAPTGVNGDRYGATGGLVTRPTRAIIGEAGPELVIPVGGGRSLDSAPGASPLSDVLGDVAQGRGAGGVTVQLVGDIYGVPSDEFVAELAVKLKKYAAGFA